LGAAAEQRGDTSRARDERRWAVAVRRRVGSGRRSRVPHVVAIALIAIACVPASAGAQVEFCGAAARACTRLAVPLDHAGRTAGEVVLEVERRSAKAGDEPPIFVLAGGPGQSATRALPADVIRQIFGPVLRRRDVVVFDQRGTGDSGALSCPSLQRAIPLVPGQAAAQCATLLGPALPFYTTDDSVADIEAVRSALGYERIALFAVSYGTTVAQQYAQAYPERVERLVLDSTLAPAGVDPLYRDSFAASPRVLRELCRSRCRGITRDPDGDLVRLVSRLRRGPIRGIVVNAQGRRRRAALTGFGLFSMLVVGDLQPQIRAQFPAATRSALNGDTAPIMRLGRLSQEAPPVGAQVLSAATFATTVCGETALPWDPAVPIDQRIAQAQARVDAMAPRAFAPFDEQTALESDVLALCERWPMAGSETLRVDAVPAMPVLLLSGSQDLRTPREIAARLARQAPRAQLVVVPAVGHSVVGVDASGCAVRAVRRFLAGRPVRRACPAGARLDPAPLDPASLRDVRPVRGTRGKPGRTLAAVRRTYQDALRIYFDVLLQRTAADPDGNVSSRYAAGGLRAGYYSFRGDRVTLRDLVYVPGVRVSGRLRSVSILPDGILRIRGRAAAHGTLRVRSGVMSGRLSGRWVRGRLGPDLFDLAFELAFASRSAIAASLAGVPG
jgi:pimeloyl-ACP methyl ester carboxylesterase